MRSDQRASPNVPRSAVVVLNLIPTLAAAGAVFLHVQAGVFDEGHAVWHPGGHLSIFAALAWLSVGAVGGASILVVGRRAPMAYFSCAVALVGLVLLFTG